MKNTYYVLQPAIPAWENIERTCICSKVFPTRQGWYISIEIAPTLYDFTCSELCGELRIAIELDNRKRKKKC